MAKNAEKIINDDSYNADSILMLEGINPVRIRPGMYIGDTSTKGLHHILWEIVDNGIDEVANGYGNNIEIEIYNDGSVSVQDDGRGIPVDLHKASNKPGLEIIFTSLHSGAKFGNEEYKYSGGLHGVGAAVTNALSRWLNVTVYKKGIAYTMEFHSVDNGKSINSGVVKTPLYAQECDKKLKGTRVHFMPDDRVFDNIKFNFDIINKRVKELAFLNNNLTITLKDNRERDEFGLPKVVKYHFQNGLIDFIRYQNDSKKTLYETPLYFENSAQNVNIVVAMQHTDGGENIVSYVNNIPTSEGGTHETGLKSGITKAMNDYAKQSGIIKEKEGTFSGEDFREGLTLVMLIQMANPEFEGQTKAKLSNAYIKPLVEQMVTTSITELLEKQNKTVINDIFAKAIQAKKERERIQNSKEVNKRMREINSNKLIGKLAQCISKDSKRNELFIVEGDSAGGTAKTGRDRNFQAILPLRGKPLNVEKTKLDKALDNQEIGTIISALGAGFHHNFNVEQLKYDKVIILADADQDGAHIRSILLTFFFRYMRPLIASGHVYIGMPPLYKIESKGETIYVYNDDELKEVLDKTTGKRALQRYKGLGEMNPEQLWETTMNPKRRKLMKVTLEDAIEAERLISILMGDNANARKEYINQNANFNKIDTFEEIGGQR